MAQNEVRNLFRGWKKVFRMSFVRAFLKDPAGGIIFLKLVVVVFFADLFYVILTPGSVREARRK